ncbi:BnaC04g03500D [Brassica napus]|uniref:BnaC04g03500D protein n=2 Tax=Brassica TaxID=3705 RepID=A0A078FXG6_BRANA|nr:BnaC04g03500D [Brassica napus]VDD04711.1 unnamed protein product [Brassica oleracea]
MDAYRAALGTVYSSKLPKSNPFWIMVQGIPLHLWTEDIIRLIGQDIGVYEKAEITTLVVRMRVHINGRLPLIKSSVLELSNGEDITASLVYEKLDKHCTYCQRLDHENRDCLKAKADKREALTIAVSMADKSQRSPHEGEIAQVIRGCSVECSKASTITRTTSFRWGISRLSHMAGKVC